MSKLLLVLAAVPVVVALIAWFARLERSGREHVAPLFIVGLVGIESLLYENQDIEPRGIFHPGSGSFQFRLPEILITCALIGRLWVRGRPRTVGYPALAWTAVGFWLTVALVEGLLRHNNTTQIPYEAKAIVYVVGGFALASGVPARRYVETRAVEKLARFLAIPCAVIDVTGFLHKQWTVHIPLLPMEDFGVMGADASSIMVAIGLAAFLIELSKPRRNRWTLLAVVPLVVAAVPSSQRAALVDLGISVLVVIVAAVTPTGHRRLNLSGGEVLIGLLAACGMFLVATIVPAAVSQTQVTVPFEAQFHKTFGSQAKSESANERVQQWDAARHLIAEEPIFGWGLGVEYQYYAVGPKQVITTDLTHDILFDLAMRTGLVGLGLFLAGLIGSVLGGVATWRYHPDGTVAVLALALTAALAGIIGKGLVESIFEKYRLATLLGITLGMLRSTATSLPRVASVRHLAEELV